MIVSKFNHQLGILVSKFEGDVTLKEILDYMIAIQEDKANPRFLKILTDATEANINLTTNDLLKIVDVNHKSLVKFDYIIDAMILKRPKETALSILYQELAKTKKYKFKMFSTKEAAIQWLEKYVAT